ncbi:hypothetical protein TRFO_20357 [Tritrichomonas foetus]|uniref:Nuclear transport factor 2 domain-containing protein n=1 Tax=Tritrichomonas foetus TaxID=1144522 RepID=A0A1J4KG58_9EUKA|nr:hypothetical protein TRFO_20357 [Tritrichomonas foetus]|eukprot:OHT10393.1 hypothetical protein TRFO_20357 [Tritrichomonas foetus]
MSRTTQFGVAIGPTEPDDKSVFKTVLENYDDINPDNCAVNSNPEYNFIWAELSYKDAKEVTGYQSRNGIKVILIDAANFEQYANKLWRDFPRNINAEGCVNFSRIKGRYKINTNFPPNISTVLFLAKMYSLKTGTPINSFNFSNNNLPNLKGFEYSFLPLFPDVKAINLSGNNIGSDEEFQTYFGAAKVILDNPIEDQNTTPSNSSTLGNSYGDNNYDDYEDYFVEQPQLDFRSLQHEPKLSLEMFPPITLNVDDFPTHRFIHTYFKMMWYDIPKCGDFYFNNSVFSLISQQSEKTNYYENCDSNLAIKEPVHIRGKENIIAALCQLFPNGFHSHPTLINCSILSENLYSVVLHGVFESYNNLILGFDRSYVISFYDYQFRILNDNMFIRDPPCVC